MKWDLIVIGGGAAGIFCAIQAGASNPLLRILILEKTSKLLSKVRVSGGGRCNVTHHSFDPTELSRHYPRGGKPLKKMFRTFQSSDVVRWFAERGVTLKTESDGRMFPVTDSSLTIIDCFMREATRLGIRIELKAAPSSVETKDDGFRIKTDGGEEFEARKLLIATGGSPGLQSYQWIARLGHTIVPPIPSLFTFNDVTGKFKDLMGISVPDAEIKIAGTKFSQQGPLLITHWGLSGPAVIKLSAWAADHLSQINYEFDVLVSWIGAVKEDIIRAELLAQMDARRKQKVFTNSPFGLPQRLWHRLCELSGIEESKVWGELSQRSVNRMLEFLIRCPFHIKGKTTFKEEFVTCGGVDLKEVDLETMESTVVRNLYFAGEVLNIDGETGGFNFQAAWTTAAIAARGIVQ